RGPAKSPGDRADRAGRPGQQAGAGPAPGPVRRAAAAGGDRPRPGRRAARADPGRVGRRARRVDPGPGAEPAGRHPRPDRGVLHPDQPRPGRRQAAHRPGHRDAPRPGGGARRHRPGPGRPAASLHPAAARQRPPAGLEAGKAAHDETGPDRGPRPRGQLVTSDLPYLSATEALARFRARELSPVELMTAVIERAEAVEPAINAFAETFYEQSLAAAKAAQERYATAGEPPRPLEGLPVAVKEEAPIAGQ